VKSCKAITKKKKPCPIPAEEWRISGMCHVHDPDGKFRTQVRNGTTRRIRKEKSPKIKKECQHTWYMREPGIQCTKCLIVWEKDERTKDYENGLAFARILASI